MLKCRHKKRRKSDSEVLGMNFFNSAEDTLSNCGGPIENSKKALLLLQNPHKTTRACVQTKWHFLNYKGNKILSENITNGLEFTS